MKLRTESETLEFIGSISAPIGPDVYAGFGNDTENSLAQDPTCTESIIEEWVANSEQMALLDLLIDIAGAAQLMEPFGMLRTRFKGHWEHVITELIYTVCDARKERRNRVISQLAQSSESKNVLNELIIWWSERA
jgi:hypothetical protein